MTKYYACDLCGKTLHSEETGNLRVVSVVPKNHGEQRFSLNADLCPTCSLGIYRAMRELIFPTMN